MVQERQRSPKAPRREAAGWKSFRALRAAARRHFQPLWRLEWYRNRNPARDFAGGETPFRAALKNIPSNLRTRFGHRA
jgi:hypothetical protein